MGTYLSRHLGWLLVVPEPREEQRGIGGAAVPFGMGALFLAISLFLSRQDQRPVDPLLFLGMLSIVQAALYILPPRLRGIVLGVGVTLTLSFVAMALSLPLTYPRPLREDSFPLWAAALLIVFLFCTNYFVNRRRALRSSRPAAP